MTGDRLLPVPVPRHARRIDAEPERAVYVARPGLAALPSGTLTLLVFAAPQTMTLSFLLWAIWWPEPGTPELRYAAWRWTVILVGSLLLVAVLLLRRYPGFLLGVIRAPFIRLTVTDRRVIWSLPWTAVPLMEIGRQRVLGGIVGMVDARGRGNAAMVLVPGDPSADIDGNIHFDRLPHVQRFVDALGG